MSTNNEKLIHLKEVSKKFDNHQALAPMNLIIYDGEFLTLLGPSGCGKTTLLRLIAGFETPDTGIVVLDNNDITSLPAEKRNINMVFQNYALFPHMTVYENVAFGLKCLKTPKRDIEEKVQSVLDRVKLTHLQHRKPDQLSGGQQQRIAIARAIVNEPLVLLLDEPLSALDYTLRKQMRLELKALQRRLGITFVLVTHDQEEALTMSDRIVVMNEGKVEQVGFPRDIYEKPKNIFVTRFIGEANIFSTTVLEANEQILVAKIADMQFVFENHHNFKKHDKINIVIRPEDINAWSLSELESTENMVPGKVTEVIYKGSTVDLVIQLNDGQVVFATEFFDMEDENLEYELGEIIYIDWTQGWEVILPDEK